MNNSFEASDQKIKISVKKIYDFFKDAQGNIQLKKIVKFLNENQQIKNKSGIFVAKLQQAVKQKKQKMNEGQFKKYFCPDLDSPQNISEQKTKRNHFKIVFKQIDTDGSNHISLKQLRELNQYYKINLSQNDMQLMIQTVARDGQKVKFQDLQQFLKK